MITNLKRTVLIVPIILAGMEILVEHLLIFTYCAQGLTSMKNDGDWRDRALYI